MGNPNSGFSGHTRRRARADERIRSLCRSRQGPFRGTQPWRYGGGCGDRARAPFEPIGASQDRRVGEWAWLRREDVRPGARLEPRHDVAHVLELHGALRWLISASVGDYVAGVAQPWQTVGLGRREPVHDPKPALRISWTPARRAATQPLDHAAMGGGSSQGRPVPIRRLAARRSGLRLSVWRRTPDGRRRASGRELCDRGNPPPISSCFVDRGRASILADILACERTLAVPGGGRSRLPIDLGIRGFLSYRLRILVIYLLILGFGGEGRPSWQ